MEEAGLLPYFMYSNISGARDFMFTQQCPRLKRCLRAISLPRRHHPLKHKHYPPSHSKIHRLCWVNLIRRQVRLRHACILCLSCRYTKLIYYIKGDGQVSGPFYDSPGGHREGPVVESFWDQR